MTINTLKSRCRSLPDCILKRKSFRLSPEIERFISFGKVFDQSNVQLIQLHLTPLMFFTFLFLFVIPPRKVLDIFFSKLFTSGRLLIQIFLCLPPRKPKLLTEYKNNVSNSKILSRHCNVIEK